MQLHSWHVFVVINALPLLLHAALLLFFAGLTVFLWLGDIAITAAMFAIVGLAYIFYIGSMWISLIVHINILSLTNYDFGASGLKLHLNL